MYLSYALTEYSYMFKIEVTYVSAESNKLPFCIGLGYVCIVNIDYLLY